ncbi:hypothetical protein [Saccharolobus islandicus]|uniref:Uncharacterized protein n=3 Tax=Saccharolobus islandicus TaxID=43080 RepID=C4KGB8_SACI6|nr:hypothetical protein [Sulfolobus islandicus]ACP37813.1 hypothetical protein M1425_1051 [Sulfolobus islandicus M.14.25]ACP55004.1 hypothetical protein M1627_1114 [Sulfolobus islandicus M.16.27]ACR41632.1 hypothetical protein M164_1025 [Sulfolobus islandicus M.16.4]
MDKKIYDEVIKPFGSYERFKKRVDDIKAEIEIRKRIGKTSEEMFVELYEIWEKEYIKAFNGDVNKAREHLMKVREWRRSLRPYRG